MYQRYAPNSNRRPKTETVPPSVPKPPPQGDRRNPPQAKREQEAKRGEKRSWLSELLPPMLYQPETKKILGMISAEDLLLAGLIFLLTEEENRENRWLLYALLYILISDYIDLPF